MQHRIVAFGPGTRVSGTSGRLSASRPSQASRAISRRTLYFKCCVFVSNFRILSTSWSASARPVCGRTDADIFCLSYHNATGLASVLREKPVFSSFSYKNLKKIGKKLAFPEKLCYNAIGLWGRQFLPPSQFSFKNAGEWYGKN